MAVNIGFTIGEALKIGTQFFGGISAHRAAAAQYIAQIKAQTRKFNYDVQSINLKRRDLYEQIVGEIEKVRLNQAKLKGSVMADLNEQYEGGGRTAQLLERNMDADEARAVHSLKDLFYGQNKELNHNIEMAVISRDEAIKGIAKPDHRSILLQNLTNLAGTVFDIALRNKKLKDSNASIDIFGRVHATKPLYDPSAGVSALAGGSSGNGGSFGYTSIPNGFGTLSSYTPRVPLYGLGSGFSTSSFGRNYFGFNNYQM